VSASVNLPLHHKVQKFSSGTGSSGWSRKKGRITVVCVWCVESKMCCIWDEITVGRVYHTMATIVYMLYIWTAEPEHDSYVSVLWKVKIQYTFFSI